MIFRDCCEGVEGPCTSVMLRMHAVSRRQQLRRQRGLYRRKRVGVDEDTSLFRYELDLLDERA